MIGVAFTTRGGRLYRDGKDFVALGVNYHPSAAGCRLWTEWDPDAVREDFGRMTGSGLNAVRFFLFWRDFMPIEGKVDHQALDRLDTVVGAAADAGLCCVPSLLTIWMNGQLLDLPWRAGRTPWRDPGMLAAQEEYVHAVADRLSGHDNVLAYDLGDELWNIDMAAAKSLSPAEVRNWQQRLADIIRSHHPEALVLQANDATAVFGSGPYGCDNQSELDVVAVHGFPPWSPGSIESTLSYKATNLPSFLASVAAAYGTPLIDELGSYGVNVGTAALSLRATTASALANGATGIFPWCWQDIVSVDEPYRERPVERFVGLHTTDGSPKPTMLEYRRTIERAADLAQPKAPARIALYLPERLRGHSGSYLDGTGSAVATFHTYLLLKRAHLQFDVVAGGELRHDLVICPSAAHFTLADAEHLREAARLGATVYVSLGDYLHGFPGADLVGAEIVDFQSTDAGRTGLRWGDRLWPIEWDLGQMRPTTMVTTTAHVLGHYPDSTPALVANPLGAGRIVFTNAPLERQFTRPGAVTTSTWPGFYRALADLAAVDPEVTCTDPDVEIIVGAHRLVVVNHGESATDAVITMGTAEHAVALERKEWTVLVR